jgi:hypothetical protein
LGQAGPADVAGAVRNFPEIREVSELDMALLRLVLVAFVVGNWTGDGDPLAAPMSRRDRNLILI